MDNIYEFPNLFKAREKETSDYIFGSLLRDKEKYFIISPDRETRDLVEVDPNTIGIYTGVNDCYNTPIYDKDKLKNIFNDDIYTVSYDNESASFKLILDDNVMLYINFENVSKDYYLVEDASNE